MGHESSTPSRASAGARAIVLLGNDPCAVAAQVRELTGDGGITLPCGPYRFPYAALVDLLRRAGLFTDPPGETATDPLLRREPLVDQLRSLVRLGIRIGIQSAAALDKASVQVLRDFAEIARMTTEHGLDASGLVIGAAPELATEFRFPLADIRHVAADRQPVPQLDAISRETLMLITSAPQPVLRSSLAGVSSASPRELQSALVKLSAAEFIEVGDRIALGPGAVSSDASSVAMNWLETPEVRLPQARLAVKHEDELALRIAREALANAEYDVAAYYFHRVTKPDANCDLLFAEALARLHRGEVARELFARSKSTASPMQVGVVATLLADAGLLTDEEADACLRRAEREAKPVEARALRASLKLNGGTGQAAYNLLRRTRKADLDSVAPNVRFEHELAFYRCLKHLGDKAGARKKLAASKEFCTTRFQLRRFAEHADDPFLSACLAAEDLDAEGLRKFPSDVIGASLKRVLPTRPELHVPTGRSLSALHSRLVGHGVALVAALVGDGLEVHPPGAATRPGLAAFVESHLRRLRNDPQLVSFNHEEFSGLGPFSGKSLVTLHAYANAGPVIVLFRETVPIELSNLL